MMKRPCADSFHSITEKIIAAGLHTSTSLRVFLNNRQLATKANPFRSITAIWTSSDLKTI